MYRGDICICTGELHRGIVNIIHIYHPKGPRTQISPKTLLFGSLDPEGHT